MCAVDTETTGLVVGKHDIIELAILPLDNHFRPSREVKPFNMTMKPRRPENIDMAALECNRTKLVDVMSNSLDSDKVADFLVEWFTRLNLGLTKRISVLAHNWLFDAQMLLEWLGPLTFELIFDGRYRDTMALALSLNDMCEERGNLCPYTRVNLSVLAKKFGIDHCDAHNALPDCRITAEVYAEMIKRHCAQ